MKPYRWSTYKPRKKQRGARNKGHGMVKRITPKFHRKHRSWWPNKPGTRLPTPQVIVSYHQPGITLDLTQW